MVLKNLKIKILHQVDYYNIFLLLMVKLYDVLNKKNLDGYSLDKTLSNHNNQVYYNDKKHDLIYNVSGTHNLKDWGTNLALITGNLKKTERYMESHKGLRTAKEKYKIDGVTVTGNSLGGGIASLIHGKNDKSFTYNKASSFGQKERPSENSFRVANDVISLFNANNKNTKTLKNNVLPSIKNSYLSHSTNHLKKHNISI